MENHHHLFQNGTVNKLAFEPMKEIVDTLNRLKKRHWLAGGTLLGKKIKKKKLRIRYR